MAREFLRPNTGATGRRRIVPMMGMDFIAGQIEVKGAPIISRNNGKTRTPYGIKPASMGGRTRRWSFINFLNINSNANAGDVKHYTQSQLNQQARFTEGTKSARATLKNLNVLTQVQQDWIADTPYFEQYPSQFATLRGWVSAVRIAQGASSTDTTWPPTQS